MSVLSDLRADLRTKLKVAGLHAFTTVPEIVTPPFVFVSPNQPYIDYEPGPDVGLLSREALVRHRLSAVGAPGTNDVRADELDELVVQILQLDLHPHQVGSVDEPGSIGLNGQTYLAVAINVYAPVRLEGP